MELAMYLPMVLTVLERDRMIFDTAPFKLKNPYLSLIEESMKAVQKDLTQARNQMRKGNMKVQKIEQDEEFTKYVYMYKGYEELKNYFNPRIRNKVLELMEHYLYKRYIKGDGHL